MKTTAQRLSVVYCRPNKEEWNSILSLLKSIEKYFWREFDSDGYCYLHESTIYLANGVVGDWSKRTEIPVTHFVGLLRDRIVDWRLEEDGFENKSAMGFREFIFTINESEGHYIEIRGGTSLLVNGERIRTNVTTYSELLNLIELVG